jgi:hypothetical protein
MSARMKNSFAGRLPTTLVAFVLASFAMILCADAAGRGGGGARGGGGGGAHASAGGGRAAQASNSRADVRTNDVRSTSVNNVNVNRNVNVNVDRGGWDNVNHPVAAAVVVGAAVGATAAAVGSMVSTVPAGCVPVNYAYSVYQQCGSTWYELKGSQYVVVNPPY